MAYQELDLTISKEALAFQKEMRTFAMKELRPAGIELDKMSDPSDVIAKESILWDIVKKTREMELHKFNIPEKLGGLGDIDPMMTILMLEELTYGDQGLAGVVFTQGMPFQIAAASGEPELQKLAEAFCRDDNGGMIGCWAMMEPDHGSDWIMASQPGFDSPDRVPTVRAEKKGDEYIITGQKAAWVTLGTMATHAILHLGLDSSKGMQGDGIAIVPLDLNGVSKGKPLDKIGMRSMNQGEIFFDNVHLPKEYMILSQPGSGMPAKEQYLVQGNSSVALMSVAIAQAAFDEALKYAKIRVQGGKPIFEHQSVRMRLFNMFRKIEGVRALARRVAYYHFRYQGPPSVAHATAAKTLATDVAFEVTSEALQIFGGNGLTKEYIVEKLFRDARENMVADGENNVLSLWGASHL